MNRLLVCSTLSLLIFGAAKATPTAESVWQTRCSLCHGAGGLGDGPAAAALKPKPRNFADAKWQKTVTDDYLKGVIVNGGASVGKSPLMAPNVDLKDNAVVLADLVKRIRAIAK